jgi:hypothetical protein
MLNNAGLVSVVPNPRHMPGSGCTRIMATGTCEAFIDDHGKRLMNLAHFCGTISPEQSLEASFDCPLLIHATDWRGSTFLPLGSILAATASSELKSISVVVIVEAAPPLPCDGSFRRSRKIMHREKVK